MILENHSNTIGGYAPATLAIVKSNLIRAQAVKDARTPQLSSPNDTSRTLNPPNNHSAYEDHPRNVRREPTPKRVAFEPTSDGSSVSDALDAPSRNSPRR